MHTETILIIALGAVSLLLVVLLVVLLVSRRTGLINPSSAFESISRRLDELARMQNRFTELEQLFLAPQKRGLLGETMLEQLITSVLPRGSYRFQHQFSDGVRVDALVKIGSRYIPIDSKFPVEALRELWEKDNNGEKLSGGLKRTLINLINDIARKYIQPREHTFSFALMYIPSEALFYEGFVRYHGNDDVFAAALKKRVIPVSPSGLFLYLETLLYGMKSYEIDRNYDKLVRTLEQLAQDFAVFSKTYATAGTHLKNLQRAFDEGKVNLEKLEGTLSQLHGRQAEALRDDE